MSLWEGHPQTPSIVLDCTLKTTMKFKKNYSSKKQDNSLKPRPPPVFFFSYSILRSDVRTPPSPLEKQIWTRRCIGAPSQLCLIWTNKSLVNQLNSSVLSRIFTFRPTWFRAYLLFLISPCPVGKAPYNIKWEIVVMYSRLTVHYDILILSYCQTNAPSCSSSFSFREHTRSTLTVTSPPPFSRFSSPGKEISRHLPLILWVHCKTQLFIKQTQFWNDGYRFLFIGNLMYNVIHKPFRNFGNPCSLRG